MPTKQCPPEIRTLINLVNACGDKYMEEIPVDDPAEAGKRLSELVDGRHTALPPRVGRPLVRLGNVAREFIWEGSADALDAAVKIEDAVRRYDMIRRGRIMLDQIVRLLKRPHAERSKFVSTTSEVSLLEMRLVKADQTHQQNKVRQTSYKIRIVKKASLLDALNGVEARIRRCEAIRCRKFIWSGRDDKRGCNKNCNAAIRKADERKRRNKAHLSSP